MNDINFFEEGKKYLLTFKEVNHEMIHAQLNAWKSQKPQTLPEVYKAILNHAKNRQGMPNSIGDIDKIKHLLFNFEHEKVLENYKKWEDLFDSIVQDNYIPPGRMVKGNNKSHWVIYCKSILSAAEFLKLFENYESFDKFIKSFWANEYTELALPLLLSENIFGFGFALACDFIKENISSKFVKPDTHINDIAYGLGITKSKNNFTIYRDVIAYCKKINAEPYEVDKIFWLIGSGSFYLNNVQIKSDKKEFIQIIKNLS